MITVNELTIFNEARDLLKELKIERFEPGIRYLDLKKKKIKKRDSIYSFCISNDVLISAEDAIQNLESMFYNEYLKTCTDQGTQSIRIETIMMLPIGLIDEPFLTIFNGDFGSNRKHTNTYQINKVKDPNLKLYKYALSKDKLSYNDLLCIGIVNKMEYSRFKKRRIYSKVNKDDLIALMDTKYGMFTAIDYDVLLDDIHLIYMGHF